MRTVKIVSGTYGYRKENTSQVKLIGKGWGCETDICNIPDEEAARLIKLGIAVDAEDSGKVAEKTVEGYLDVEELEKLSTKDLKKLANELGLEFKARDKKEDLIKLIVSAEAQASTEDVSDEEDTDNEETTEDDEEPPVLDAVDPE